MNKNKLYQYFLLGLLLIFLYLSFLVVKPFLTYIIFGLILVFISYPVYKFINKKWIKSEKWSSAIMILLLLLVIIIPLSFIITGLVDQSISAFEVVQNTNIKQYATVPVNSEIVQEGASFLDESIKKVAKALSDYFVNAAPDIIGGVADTLLGLFIMFFVMFFGYIDGARWFKKIKTVFPMRETQKEEFFKKIEVMIKGILYGQTLSAIIQGSLGGLMLWIFGIPNSIFWGFLMIILSFFPFVGTPLVWAPLALIELFNKNYVSGIGVLVVGFVIIMNIDNFIKPRLIGEKTNINQAVILIGVLGGLKLMGFIGLILGPLILAILGILLSFDYKALKLD